MGSTGGNSSMLPTIGVAKRRGSMSHSTRSNLTALHGRKTVLRCGQSTQRVILKSSVACGSLSILIPSDHLAFRRQIKNTKLQSKVAGECREWLAEQGWPAPILADSGNGAHLLYRIDLPNDDASTKLLRSVLQAIADRMSDDRVDVDKGVYNAARICKLYGTLSAKGDATDERPHRISKILEVPDQLEVTSFELLDRLVERCGNQTKTSDQSQRTPNAGLTVFDLEAWLRHFNVPVQGDKPWRGGTLFNLTNCPFRPEEKDGGAWIARNADGDAFAGCHHNKCQDKKWPDFKRHFESKSDLTEQGLLIGSKSMAPLVWESHDDPDRLARLFVQQYCTHPDGLTLVYWISTFFRWNGTIWRPYPTDELKASLRKTVRDTFARLGIGSDKPVRKVSINVMANVLSALQDVLILPSSQDLPAWIGEQEPFPANEMIVATNGLIHLPSLMDGGDFLLPHSPMLFATAGVNFDVVRDAADPARWLAFLAELWPNDSQSIDTLQHWFGYCLTADASQQKILLIIGPKRSGKGTILRVLTELVGRSNVVAPTLSSLSQPFGLQSLLGMTVAMIGDARLSGRWDSSIITERLLTISGEDTITVERKYKEAITTKLKVRFIITSNELPRVVDASGAIVSRMLILRLTKSFFGKEETRLIERLLTELPGVFLWALEGRRKLQEQGYFIEPDSASTLRHDLEGIVSPVAEFVCEWCELGPLHEIPRAGLYQAYVAWCREKGHRRVEMDAVFGRNLHAVIPELETSQPRTADGGRERHYVGIDLKDGIRSKLRGLN